MRATLKKGDTVRARVVATAPHGIHLDHQGFEILVHITDVPWGGEVGATEYARPGDELDVKILRLTDDGTEALGWLPWPHWHSGRPPTPASPG